MRSAIDIGFSEALCTRVGFAPKSCAQRIVRSRLRKMIPSRCKALVSVGIGVGTKGPADKDLRYQRAGVYGDQHGGPLLVVLVG